MRPVVKRAFQPTRVDMLPLALRQGFDTMVTGRPGPVVGVSDYMRELQDLIRPWVPGDYATLGTDGWGMSDTRGALRRHFLVDAQSITVQTLAMLARRGEFEAHRVQEAIDRYQLRDPKAAGAGNTEGSG